MGDELRCSFCAKPQESVRKLIAGPLVFICDECVQVCVDIIKDDERLAGPEPDQHPPTMPGLMDHLAAVSTQDQWLLVMYLLARLRERQLGP